jgi:peptidoglycan hydrolase-like protein with peptidoglycan-binding domain
MTKITENELKNKVSRLREYLAVIEATAPGMGQKGPTVAAAQGVDPSNPLNKSTANAGLDASGRKTATTDPRVGQTTSATTQSTKPAPVAKPAGPPKVAYEKDFPEETAKELQTKLNAVGEKLTVDGKMGPATRAAMARHPEITSNPNATAAAPEERQPNGASGAHSRYPLPAPEPAAPAAPKAARNLGIERDLAALEQRRPFIRVRFVTISR